MRVGQNAKRFDLIAPQQTAVFADSIGQPFLLSEPFSVCIIGLLPRSFPRQTRGQHPGVHVPLYRWRDQQCSLSLRGKRNPVRERRWREDLIENDTVRRVRGGEWNIIATRFRNDVAYKIKSPAVVKVGSFSFPAPS